MEKFKEAVSDINAHAIFIGHLDKNGKTKGSTDIVHLADVVCHIKPHEKWLDDSGYSHEPVPGVFYIKIDKNRYGQSGGYVAFRHMANGIVEVDSSIKDFNAATVVNQQQEEPSLLSKFFGGVLRYIEGKTG